MVVMRVEAYAGRALCEWIVGDTRDCAVFQIDDLVPVPTSELGCRDGAQEAPDAGG